MVAGCPIVNATAWPVSAENFAAIALAAAKGAPVLKTRSTAPPAARGASAAISSNPAVRALWRRREWAVARFSVIAILPYPMLLSAVLMRRRKISPRRPSQRSTHAASRRPDGFQSRSDLKYTTMDLAVPSHLSFCDDHGSRASRPDISLRRSVGEQNERKEHRAAQCRGRLQTDISVCKPVTRRRAGSAYQSNGEPVIIKPGQKSVAPEKQHERERGSQSEGSACVAETHAIRRRIAAYRPRDSSQKHGHRVEAIHRQEVSRIVPPPCDPPDSNRHDQKHDRERNRIGKTHPEIMKDVADVGCRRADDDDRNPIVQSARASSAALDDEHGRQAAGKVGNAAQVAEVNYISNKVACVRTEYAGKAQGCPICGVDFRNTFHRYCLIVFPAFTSAPGPPHVRGSRQ